MQPMWLCIIPCRQFDETFENTQWRKVKQMQSMRLCIISSKLFEDAFKKPSKISKKCNQCGFASLWVNALRKHMEMHINAWNYENMIWLMQSTLYRVTQTMQHIYIEVPTNRKVGEQYFHCICRIKETLTRNVISIPFLLWPAYPADFSTWGSMISNVQPFPRPLCPFDT